MWSESPFEAPITKASTQQVTAARLSKVSENTTLFSVFSLDNRATQFCETSPNPELTAADEGAVYLGR